MQSVQGQKALHHKNPEQRASGQKTSEQKALHRVAPDQNAPEQDVPDQNVSDQNVPDQNVSDRAGVLERLEIAGFEPSTGSDWPGKIAAVVFLQGCPWRCGYCHNFDIIDPHKPGILSWSRVREHLDQVRGVLDGVVFSGGEPTAQRLVVEAARQVKEMGLGVALHTNGAFPERLAELIPYLDWVALDIKAPSHKYAAITGRSIDDRSALRSLELLLDAGITVQVRTTLDPLVLDEDDIVSIREHMLLLGVTDYVVQRVHLDGTNPEYARALTQYREKAALGGLDVQPLHG